MGISILSYDSYPMSSMCSNLISSMSVDVVLMRSVGNALLARVSHTHTHVATYLGVLSIWVLSAST